MSRHGLLEAIDAPSEALSGRADASLAVERFNAPPGVAPVPARPSGRQLEGVPLGSGRAAAGLSLLVVMGLAIAVLVLPPLLDFLGDGEAAPLPVITAEAMWANMAVQVLLFLLLPILYLVVVRPGEQLSDLLLLAPRSRVLPNLGKGVLLAIAITLILAGVLFFLQWSGLVREEESLLVGELGRLVRAHPEFLIVAPLVAGVCEEVFFRGLLQPRIGIIGSNVVFGLVHLGYGTVLQVVVPALLGVAFGLAYARWRSLWACIAAHATFDLIQFGGLYATEVAAPSIVGFF